MIGLRQDGVAQHLGTLEPPGGLFSNHQPPAQNRQLWITLRRDGLFNCAQTICPRQRPNTNRTSTAQAPPSCSLAEFHLGYTLRGTPHRPVQTPSTQRSPRPRWCVMHGQRRSQSSPPSGASASSAPSWCSRFSRRCSGWYHRCDHNNLRFFLCELTHC